MNGTTPVSSKRLYRAQFIQLLDAALTARSFRFGRQAALAWLTIYPGDLHTNLMQAKLLLGEGKTGQALPMLDRLARLDPDWAEPHRAIAQNTYGTDSQRYSQAVTSLVALKEGRPAGPAVKEWGPLIREARQLFERGNTEEAWHAMQMVISQGEVAPVAQVLHLRLMAATQDVPSVYRLADTYYNRNNDCLQINLLYADALMQLGSEPEAVSLLHRSMSMDASGQVANRLWGANHPYQSIWPEELSIHFDLAIPSDVASRLGWVWMLPQSSSGFALVPVAPEQPEVTSPVASIPDLEPETEAIITTTTTAVEPAVTVPVIDEKAGKVSRSNGKGPSRIDEVGPEKAANPIEAEFERLAHRLKKPALSRTDGRFPVYVIFSTRKGLEKQYGPQTTSVLDGEMRKLADAARRRTGWESIVFYADDEKSAAAQGLTTVIERDPWKLKLAIADLDKALAKKGLMIGMMLIVGGTQVVPFHELPNPTDDFDEKVLSDNPYATLDSNYFVPEWPLGRLPGSSGADAGPLLEQLRYLITYHNRRSKAKSASSVLSGLAAIFQALGQIFTRPGEKPNFGYSAAVWRRSSLAVFRPVGSPNQVLISPPQVSTSVPVDKMMVPELCYFNLHGLSDAAEWYGQRDPGEPATGPDYPVALSPKELHRNGHAPRVIFSEACYGGLVANKSEDEALSLKFLALGTLAVVGSTCIAYGAINTPLVAADLLGNYFWQQVKAGRPVGESLMVAKVELVREMIKRQGFLDSEDQKTLLSFVLYGDPLVGLEVGSKRAKNLPRFKRHTTVKTIDERPLPESVIAPVSDKVLEQVKEAVASCLPGIETADVNIREEYGEELELAAKGNKTAKSNSRYVVTLSKKNPSARAMHRHYARATVQNGKIIKLVVSR
jgi:hypothetical protein